jgi:hypothetical protein
MTSSITAIAFSTAMLACVPFGTILWRKHDSKLCEKDRKWRDHQVARLEFLKDCMKAETDPAPASHPELQSVHLAGSLSTPGNVPFEHR